MGKKKFISKKKSATFRLFPRDTAGEGGQESDRVFVRIDNNPVPCPGFLEDDDAGHSGPEVDPYSIFADAPGDTSDDEGFLRGPLPGIGAASSRSGTEGQLPERVREILELGLPNDGYNYLMHLREIKSTGGGASYFDNPKAKLDRLPLDVKAYDASKLRIDSELRDDEDRDAVYAVASNTRAVKLQRALDPDVLRLLDDSDLSRFGSDDGEDLEEDFVIKANQGDEDQALEELEKKPKKDKNDTDFLVRGSLLHQQEQEVDAAAEKPRVRTVLDEQFDLLLEKEYGSDSDIDDGASGGIGQQLLNPKVHEALEALALDDLKLPENNSVPRDTEVIRRCAEYAERYLNESESEKEAVYVEQSSDESEAWDCETILTTYSSLHNRPRIIDAPENPKETKLPRNSLGESSGAKSNLIILGGKDKLPVDYLPNKRETRNKVKPSASLNNEKPKRREESREEKKQRKCAVKEEKRESRIAKKELKGLYRSEAQRVQQTAVSGPSYIHIT